MISTSLVAIAIATRSEPASARALEAPAPAAAAPSGEADREATVARAKSAAKRGDYAGALVEFERARALQATPQLHFNVAVCHHALTLAAAEGSPEREAHRTAAIAAYRAYLDASPNADDRADVERIVGELGGSTGRAPTEQERSWDDPEQPPPPELREIVTRIDPDPPQPEPAAPPTFAPTPVSRVHGRVGPYVPVVLAHMGRLGDTGRVAVAPMIGLGVRGGVFLGRRERINLGGEVAAYGMPVAPSGKHTLVGAMLTAAFEYGDTVGRSRRFAIAGGFIVGPAFESLRYGSTDTTPDDGVGKARCSVDRKDEVSARAGAVIAPRLALMVLLGKKRRHELGLRITPALALFGGGSSNGGSSCTQTPFAEVGLPGRAALVTTIDLGYAPRL